jgi:hypothetical protein
MTGHMEVNGALVPHHPDLNGKTVMKNNVIGGNGWHACARQDHPDEV